MFYVIDVVILALRTGRKFWYQYQATMVRGCEEFKRRQCTQTDNNKY